MENRNLQYIEVANRLKRGTVEGRVLWEPTGKHAREFTACLGDGTHAAIVETPGNAPSVLFTMSTAQGVQTLHLDSSRVSDELLRLALLQLFVAVRDTVAGYAASQALQAVRDL